jgi:hypothetical protein
MGNAIENRKQDIEELYSADKFWTGVHVRLAKINKKRVYISRVTPLNQSTITNQVNNGSWPDTIYVYYIAKALNTTVEELIEDSKIK